MPDSEIDCHQTVLEDRLRALIQNSFVLTDTLDVCRRLGVKDHYIAGGAVTQVVWNQLTDRPVHDNIKDIDVVYFDESHTVADQSALQSEISRMLSDKFPIDLKNQALVHTWYASKFGYEIPRYLSSEDGIETWLPAFAVGVRLQETGVSVHAPFGLGDLFAMTMRPNRKQITEQIYLRMIENVTARWPDAKIEPWRVG